MSISFSYYARCLCPSCKAPNWFLTGASGDDDTSYYGDMFALECWKCHQINWFGEDQQEEAQIMYGEYDEQDNPIPVKPEDCADLGKEHP